ncbi:NADAR family protein [Oricola indica]|uniref:NADAR family protein n=1 Tax=Oricola indica TaxID=2872591 RepID=UPI001CBD04D3|nr:NADAR family protein [Oricola indica]
MNEIRFYRASEKPYGAFSNLYRREVVFDGEVFATSEHAYQAGKARKPAVRKWLMEAPSPALLAMAAHGLYYWDVAPGWSKMKFDRMRAVLRAKFTQHNDLRVLLLSTGDARIVETATVDNEVNRLWGEVNGIGRNMLGVLLMEVRDELRAGADESEAYLYAAE